MTTRKAARSDRGSGSMLMVGVLTVVLMIGLGGVCVAGYLVAAQRSRAAADLSAVSGAADIASGGDGCAVASRTARSNGAKVVSCDRVGDQFDFVITVRVEVAVSTGVAGLPRTIRATAHAGANAQ